jgi:predicted metal-dependent phosphoesterase TrpH
MGRLLHLFGAALCAAGLAIGTISDERPASASIRSGEFWILRGDFHVHAFPGDGSLTPPVLREEARRAGLDVIAITNHNQAVTGQLAQWLTGNTEGPIMIGGEEVTNPHYHLIAIGIKDKVSADQTAADAIAAIHAQNAIAIAAHPSPTFTGYDDAALSMVDGTEAAHPGDTEERQEFVDTFDRVRRMNPHLAPIGSSDIHVTPALGACRTYLFVRERSISGVLEAIRAGRTVAADEGGSLYGAPDLVEGVRNAAPPARSDRHAFLRRFSLVLAWLGLVSMLIFNSCKAS